MLGSDEMVTEITLPEVDREAKQNFLKFTLRKPVDFAVLSVASVITLRKDLFVDVRIALGAVAAAPVRAEKAEAFLKGRRIDEQAASEAAERAVAAARPLSMNAYKIEIARVLVKRSVLGLPGDPCLSSA